MLRPGVLTHGGTAQLPGGSADPHRNVLLESNPRYVRDCASILAEQMHNCVWSVCSRSLTELRCPDHIASAAMVSDWLFRYGVPAWVAA